MGEMSVKVTRVLHNGKQNIETLDVLCHNYRQPEVSLLTIPLSNPRRPRLLLALSMILFLETGVGVNFCTRLSRRLSIVAPY